MGVAIAETLPKQFAVIGTILLDDSAIPIRREVDGLTEYDGNR